MILLERLGWPVRAEIQDKSLMKIADRYVHGPVEDITSKLAAEPAMRFHLFHLSLLADSMLENKLENFFPALILVTLKPIHICKKPLIPCLAWLVEKRFVRRTNLGTEEETWDDEVPSWVDVAQSASGVSLSKSSVREPTRGYIWLSKGLENRYLSPRISQRMKA